jgi:hypothetical protein
MASKRPLVVKSSGKLQELQSPDIVDSSLLDATLSSLAAYNTNGLLTQTAADTFTGRTVTGTTNQINVSNGSGVAGNPTLSIASNVVLPGTGGATVPTGTTAQEAGGSGTVRYDTTLNKFRFNENGVWVSLGTGNGSVTSFSAGNLSPYFTTNVATATTTPSLTFTASTFANLTVLGNVSGGAAVPVALTATELTTIPNIFTSALKGLVPLSGGGTVNFLRADGTWAKPYVPRFTSSDQTITAGGSLTLAHGLGASPAKVWFDLVCTTAELGFSVGQRIPGADMTTGKNGTGPALVVVPDATNLNVRFGSASPVFQVCRFDTGASVNLTNTSWTVRFYAEI